MNLDYSAMTTRIITELQSSGVTDYSAAEVDSQITASLKEYAHFQPHIVPVTLAVESRYGTCGSTSANNLIDTAKGQFLTTDATNEKVVYNKTDRTWAVVASVASTASIGLTQDIFTVGENYRLYNQRCWNEKQLYIGGMPDYVEIDSVEYPIGQRRNFTILNDVLEMDVDGVANSDASSAMATLPDVNVLVRFNRPHVLTNLTDLVGKLAATCASAVTTISGTSLQTAGTIAIGNEFYIQGLRTLYTVTSDCTITANTVAITFYPPLESALASTTTTFTFTKSSLSAQQEETFADLCAARLAINKVPKYYNLANSAITNIVAAATSVSNMSAQLLLAATAISNMTGQITAGTAAVTLAKTELDKTVALITAANSVIVQVNAVVDLASTALAAGTTLINTITVDDTPQTDWINSAQGQLAVAQGLLVEANGFFSQAGQDENLAGAYGNQAMRNMSLAAQYLNQASGYFRQVSSQLSVSNAGRLLESWGQLKLAETLRRLRCNTKPKVSRRFPTE